MPQVATAEREEFRQVVRAFLTVHAALPAVRRAMPDGYDPSLWRRFADLGVAGLAVPAELGGAGCGFEEVAVVCEEIGRAITPAPYLSTAVLAVGALLAAEDTAAAGRLLPAICAGETSATVIVGVDTKRLPRPGATGSAEPAGDTPAHPRGGSPAGAEPAGGTPAHPRGDPSAGAAGGEGLFTGACGKLVARPGGGALLISGSAAPVVDGHVADVLIVLADSEAGPVCAEVAGTAAGLRRTRLAALDQTRELASVEFRDVRAAPIGNPGDGEGVARIATRVAGLGAAALAAEQAGGAARCLELATGHAGERVQFGRPIGSFQAVKHRLADMVVQVESARSAARHAAWAADHEPALLRVYASIAKSYCSEAYLGVAGDCIQIHGGIGVTWEHPAHLYFKRATADAILFGSPVQHRAWLHGAAGLAGFS
jgi:alkylation response protein AidB-like acyl-CoA dehydrogenase